MILVSTLELKIVLQKFHYKLQIQVSNVLSCGKFGEKFVKSNLSSQVNGIVQGYVYEDIQSSRGISAIRGSPALRGGLSKGT